MAEVVSFVANTTPAPPSGARTALKALAWALGVPTALAVLCVAFWDAGFLSGMMPSPLGQGAGIVGGILAAFGLATLLVAGGITYRELPIVSVMAFVLFARSRRLSSNSQPNHGNARRSNALFSDSASSRVNIGVVIGGITRRGIKSSRIRDVVRTGASYGSRRNARNGTICSASGPNGRGSTEPEAARPAVSIPPSSCRPA